MSCQKPDGIVKFRTVCKSEKHEQEGRSSEGPVTGQEMETQVLSLKSCNIARRLLTHVLVPKWLLPFLECFPQFDIEQERLLFVYTLGALKIYSLSCGRRLTYCCPRMENSQAWHTHMVVK